MLTDTELEAMSKRYMEMQARYAEQSALVIDLNNPATRANMIFARAELDPWARTIDRLNARVP
jgi:hypothetical protein